MDKKTFHKKWYYPLIQLVFWGSLTFLIGIGIWAILYEDDMSFVGVIWVIVASLGYWLIKKAFYRVMFGEKILQ